jgi:hypothetical protein
MTISVRDAGVHKTATPSVKDAGAWKDWVSGHVKDAGVWREFFSAVTVSLVATGYTRAGASPASFRIGNDGVVYAPVGGGDLISQYSWLLAGAAGDYEVRVDVTSGSLSTGTAGTWLNCGTTQTWTRQSGAGTFQSCTFTVQMRRASDGTVLATAEIGLTCDRT